MCIEFPRLCHPRASSIQHRQIEAFFESNLHDRLIIEGLPVLSAASFPSLAEGSAVEGSFFPLTEILLPLSFLRKLRIQEVINKKGSFFVELRFYNGILWSPHGIYHPKESLRKNSYEIFSKLCKTNPIFRKKKMMQSIYIQRIIKNFPPSGRAKTNPIQTQFKAKQSQFKANFGPISPVANPNKPNLFSVLSPPFSVFCFMRKSL